MRRRACSTAGVRTTSRRGSSTSFRRRMSSATGCARRRGATTARRRGARSPPATEEQLGRFTTMMPFERLHAAYEGDAIIGGAGAFPFELSVPGGGSLPCAGVTVVGVYPTHRRRGALRAMMDVQLRDIHERGE